MSDGSGLSADIQARVGTLNLELKLELAASSLLVLLGPNGAGKTSLLKLVLGLLPIARGTLRLGHTVLFDSATSTNVAIEQRRIGYLPQDYALFPHLTVRGNVQFALASGQPQLSAPLRREKVQAMLEELDLAGLAERQPGTLSGGERQRLALARAMCVQPRALLLDEPLAALDVHSRREVCQFLADYLRRLHIVTVVVTHDYADARRLAGQVAVLEQGRIIQSGTWDQLQARPASPFAREFFNLRPRCLDFEPL